MKTTTRTLAAIGLATTLTITTAACAAAPDGATSLDLIPHVHDVAFDADGALLVGAHTGAYRVDPTSEEVSLVGGVSFDAMGLTVQAGTLVASGHPAPDNQDDTFIVNRPRFDAVSFRVWKEDIDHAEEDSGGDEAASDPACARSSR
jgi:hypothetical protein